MTTTTLDAPLMPRLEEELPTLDSAGGFKLFLLGFFGFLLAAGVTAGAIMYASQMKPDGNHRFDDIQVRSYIKGAHGQ